MEIRPGIVFRDNATGKCDWTPLRTRVTSLRTENEVLPYAIPGGLIGVGTTLDPYFCKADRMAGQLLGAMGTLPKVYCMTNIEFVQFEELPGSKGKKKASINLIPLHFYMRKSIKFKFKVTFSYICQAIKV